MLDEHPLVLDDLRAGLVEPYRVYHGQAHIDALLVDFHARHAAFHLSDAVELAIWFHVAVYAPGAGYNERRSAILLRAMLDDLTSAPTLAVAEALVLATERHAIPPGLPPLPVADVAMVLDMDMAILGAPPANHDHYAEWVAREFIPVVGKVAYGQGRVAFLRDALDTGRPLFLTA